MNTTHTIQLSTKFTNIHDRYWVTSDGMLLSDWGGELKPLNPCIQSSGYRQFKFSPPVPGEKPVNLLLHRIIAICFIDNPTEAKEVDHIDGDKLNNAITNLRWVTAKTNIQSFHNQKRSRKLLLRNRDTGAIYDTYAAAARSTGAEDRNEINVFVNLFRRDSYIKGTWQLFKGDDATTAKALIKEDHILLETYLKSMERAPNVA